MCQGKRPLQWFPLTLLESHRCRPLVDTQSTGAGCGWSKRLFKQTATQNRMFEAGNLDERREHLVANQPLIFETWSFYKLSFQQIIFWSSFLFIVYSDWQSQAQLSFFYHQWQSCSPPWCLPHQTAPRQFNFTTTSNVDEDEEKCRYHNEMKFTSKNTRA